MEFETRLLNEVLEKSRSGEPMDLAAATKILNVTKQYFTMRSQVHRVVANEAKLIDISVA